MVILQDLVAVWDTDGAWTAPALSLGVSVRARSLAHMAPAHQPCSGQGCICLHAANLRAFRLSSGAARGLGKVRGCSGHGVCLC